MTTDTVTHFQDLALSNPVLKALQEIGYETPSPIQAQTIPLLLEGRDVLGQAQTGTGKTAAFALPVLSTIELKQRQPQCLVLAPTRELAIQVAEAFQKYAMHIKGFHVLPIYGGQDYKVQIQGLQRGAHVVVGTPGRVMDHMRRGTLKLDQLKTLVLDEADEMLRMGFIDDVEWVLEKTPSTRQIALFSATMPTVIRRIANQHLNDPAEITIQVKTTTAETIRQRFWPVSGTHKLDALTRILEAEDFDAMIIFVRTRNATVELSEKLEARGYASAALNGDIQQNQREKIVNDLKKGRLDILVATDVVARGLDVERISHVLNYDIPNDTEAYVHRIGRTGRAGRKGDAILFVAPREKRMLQAIEKATRQQIEIMDLPSTEYINDKRVAGFKQKITDTLAGEGLELYYQMIEQYQMEHNVPALEVAAALAKLLQGDTPFLLQNKPPRKQKREEFDEPREARRPDRERSSHEKREKPARRETPLSKDMERFRIEVGHKHNVQPGNIVGAIANEAGLDFDNIGRIKIFDDYSLVELPVGMPRDIFNILRSTWVSGQQLNISRLAGEFKGDRDKKPGKKEKPDRKKSAKKESVDKKKKKNRKDKDKGKRRTPAGNSDSKTTAKPRDRKK